MGTKSLIEEVLEAKGDHPYFGEPDGGLPDWGLALCRVLERRLFQDKQPSRPALFPGLIPGDVVTTGVRSMYQIRNYRGDGMWAALRLDTSVPIKNCMVLKEEVQKIYRHGQLFWSEEAV